MKKIVLTGGGTAGHVTPNIALLPDLFELGYSVEYIGSYAGIEKELIEKEGVPYHGISSGKLRRYIDLKNITDPFRVIKGFFQARKLLKEIKPDIVFSKGGYVSVPVVIAAGRLNIPVIIHESDMTPGLANRLCFKSATKVCCNFPETVKLLPEDKAVLSGSPIRRELLMGDKEKARERAGFTDDKPVLMCVGGSLGSEAGNGAIRADLTELLKDFNIIHICGRNNVDESLNGISGYYQKDYASDDMKDYYALSDIICSRAGANVICEILALKKPSVLVPLPSGGSRGDQILNAESFARQGFARCVAQEEAVKPGRLHEIIKETFDDRKNYIAAMEASCQSNGIDTIIGLIKEYS